MKQKNRWERNRKWMFPLIGILLIATVIFLSSDYGKVLGDYSKAWSDTELYENALQKVQQNTRVKEVLGTIAPIGKMTILNGEVQYEEDYNAVRSTIKISGTNGKAMMDISAHRVNGVWNYTTIRIRIKNPPEKKETIEITKTVK